MLLRSNPLESLEALRAIEAVLARGRWHARAELDRWLVEAAARAPGY